MGFGGIRLFLSLLLAFAVASSASRNTIPFSAAGNNEMMMAMEQRRSLTARLDDYDDSSANSRHDPPSVPKAAKARRVTGRG